MNGRPGAMNFSYSPLLRDFTKATNIRLRFLRTNTLLGHLMGKALRDPTVTRRVSGRGPWGGSCRGGGGGAAGTTWAGPRGAGPRGAGAGAWSLARARARGVQYYYSIKDISVGGRCVCHGHADVCDAKDPADPFR